MDCRTSDFLPRTLQSDAQGNAFIGVSGYGLEIVDGGAYGPENIITLVRGDDGIGGIGPGFVLEDQIRCNTGNRLMGRFTGLQLTAARTSPVLDAVKVRIFTNPNATTTDKDPGGVSLVNYIANGSQLALAANGFKLLYASAAAGEFEQARLGEWRYEMRKWFWGWVAGNGAFHLALWAKQDTFNGAGVWQLVMQDVSYKGVAEVAPPHPGGINGNWINLAEGSQSNTLVGKPRPVPAGSWELYLYNADGAAAHDFYWKIGVTSGL